MPAVALARPAPKKHHRHPKPKHPRAKITGAGKTLELPYAPVGADFGGWADQYAVTERPGRVPLVQHTGNSADTLALAFTLTHRSRNTSVENYLYQLNNIVQGGRIVLVGLSARERGPWYCTDVNVSVTQRQHGTNNATVADVSLTLTRATDLPPLGPLNGGKKKHHGGGKHHGTPGNPKKVRHYVIRRGDTLRSIADKFYGEPGKWQQIAKANHITNPRNIKVGRRLTIPVEK